MNNVLIEVQRYRFARLDLLLRNLGEPEQQQIIQRIRQSRELRLSKLASGMEYASMPSRKSAPLRGIARGIAIHTFCHDGVNHRTLLMAEDVNKYFPRLFRHGMPSGYYVDTSGAKPILGFVRVDTGLDHITRILQQFRKQFERHASSPEFAAITAAGQFEISYLVPTEMKAVAINTASGHQPTCRAMAVPLLLDLLAPLIVQKTLPDVVGL